MAGPNQPYTQLDADQVLKQSFDEANDRLRVDAQVTATIGTVEAQIDGTGATPSSIQITDGFDFLAINADGSINANTEIDAADGDNIMIVGTEDGLFPGTQHPAKIGSNGNLRVQDEILIAKFVDGNDIGDVTINNTTLNPVPITNSVMEAALTSLDTDFDVALSTRASEATLALLNAKFVGGNDIGDVTINNTTLNPVPVDIVDTDFDIRDLSASQDNILIAGTEDGTTTGTIRYSVNNRRLQVLDAHDRNEDITYADFGTKDERITRIDYTSATFPGITVRQDITYTLTAGKYRRDSIDWSVF